MMEREGRNGAITPCHASPSAFASTQTKYRGFLPKPLCWLLMTLCGPQPGEAAAESQELLASVSDPGPDAAPRRGLGRLNFDFSFGAIYGLSTRG